MVCSDYELNHVEQIVQMCLSSFSALLSIVGSSLLIYIIICGGWAKICRVHSRILLMMSIIDVLSSFAFGLGSLPTPRDVTCAYGYGNYSTCDAQGFFIQLGLSIPAYNAMMAIYFLAMIRYNMDETCFIRKAEPYLHAIVLIPTLGVASVGLGQNLYFRDSSQCWINEDELDGKGRFMIIFSLTFGCTSALILHSCMMSIYCLLKKRAKINNTYLDDSHNFSGDDESRELSGIEIAAKEAAYQALLYWIGYVFSFGPITVVLIGEAITGKPINNKYVQFVIAFTFPLQGFWNILAYTRPRISLLQKENPDFSFVSAMIHIISSAKGERRRSRPSHSRGIQTRNNASEFGTVLEIDSISEIGSIDT